MKFFFGPMSKNVVDSLVELSIQYPTSELVFIPSRRQIDFSKGYVNNWNTQEFTEYVKSKNPAIKIQRDHGGPDQGSSYDDGFDSLREDCKYFDIIHIDPWKRYPVFEDGLQMTVKMIEFCYALNPAIQYEVCTEEAIRPFKVSEVESLLVELKLRLKPEIFKQIKYVVIQCGTLLSNMKNCGNFNPNRLERMLAVAAKYNLIAKEHNGDWVTPEKVKVKEEFGLHNINIAPELACLESTVVLETMKENKDHYNNLFQLCLASDKWRKWVSPEFDPLENKDKVIIITAHYIFSHPTFIEIKQQYPLLDSKIKEMFHIRLKDMLQNNT